LDFRFYIHPHHRRRTHMHIPDAMITGAICPVTAALAAGLAGAAVFTAVKGKEEARPVSFAAVTALIFVLQMLNYPVSAATSGHLIGGVLAATLLGIPLGILSLSLVLMVQAVFFGDGGLTVLGANILLMSGAGAGFGGLLRHVLIQKSENPLLRNLATAFAAWCSVVVAACLCSFFLASGSEASLSAVLWPMLKVHALIGVGEAVLTLAMVALARRMPKLILPMAAALFLTPFASGYPDGLEFVAENFHLPEGISIFSAPMPDYTLPFPLLPETLSVMAAGLAGILICQILAAALARSMGQKGVGPLFGQWSL
jgi:cobalt/nickel transport system permease protein